MNPRLFVYNPPPCKQKPNTPQRQNIHNKMLTYLFVVCAHIFGDTCDTIPGHTPATTPTVTYGTTSAATPDATSPLTSTDATTSDATTSSSTTDATAQSAWVLPSMFAGSATALTCLGGPAALPFTLILSLSRQAELSAADQREDALLQQLAEARAHVEYERRVRQSAEAERDDMQVAHTILKAGYSVLQEKHKAHLMNFTALQAKHTALHAARMQAIAGVVCLVMVVCVLARFLFVNVPITTVRIRKECTRDHMSEGQVFLRKHLFKIKDDLTRQVKEQRQRIADLGFEVAILQNEDEVLCSDVRALHGEAARLRSKVNVLSTRLATAEIAKCALSAGKVQVEQALACAKRVGVFPTPGNICVTLGGVKCRAY